MGEMVNVSSAEIKKNVGRLRDMALMQAVTITRNKRDRAFMRDWARSQTTGV